MKEIIIAENLKMKRTVARKMIIFAPLFNILLTSLSGQYFFACAFNWWYTLFFSSIIAIIAVQVSEKESKKLDYKNVYMLPMNRRAMWSGKLFLTSAYVLASCAVLTIAIVLIAAVTGIQMKTGILGALCAALVIFLTMAFQIPIYLYLAKKFHFVIPFLISILFSALGIAFATKSYWWAVPFAWCNRLMCTILQVLPNGLFLSDADKGLMVPIWQVAVVIVAGIILYFAGVFITSVLFEKEAEHR